MDIAMYGTVKATETKSWWGLPKNFYNTTTYNYKEVEGFIEKLTKLNYECYQTDEGCLGVGDWICVAPDEKHCFVIRERFDTNWSSVHTVEKTNGIPTEVQKEIDEFWERLEEE